MIPIENLKIGDKVYTIYHDGKLGESGIIREVKVIKITSKKIDVVTEDGTKWSFHNDGKYGYIGLEHNRFQFMNLFLGTREEAEEADRNRTDSEDLFVEACNLFSEKRQSIPNDKLKEIIRLLK